MDVPFSELVGYTCIESHPRPFLVVFVNGGVHIVGDPEGTERIINFHLRYIEVKRWPGYQ